VTKREFNAHFLQTLERATSGHSSLSQFIQASSGADHANLINEMFPPSMYQCGEDVIDQMNSKAINDEVQAALQQYAKPKLPQTLHTKMKQRQKAATQEKPS
jgi:hypothetical protein